MTENTLDKKISEVIAVVEKQKLLVAETEKKSLRNWITTGVVTSLSAKLHLQTAKEPAIVSTFAEMLMLESYYSKAASELKSDSKFLIDGFSLEEWKTDFESRLNKIKLKNEKDKLEKLEERLKSIMSEDHKRTRELDQIMRELEG